MLISITTKKKKRSEHLSDNIINKTTNQLSLGRYEKKRSEIIKYLVPKIHMGKYSLLFPSKLVFLQTDCNSSCWGGGGREGSIGSMYQL